MAECPAEVARVGLGVRLSHLNGVQPCASGRVSVWLPLFSRLHSLAFGRALRYHNFPLGHVYMCVFQKHSRSARVVWQAWYTIM